MDDATIRADNNHGEEKWIKHYSNKHKILLVGEGDFSFSVCLAKVFGSATNMIATSLDSKSVILDGSLLINYSKAGQNLEELDRSGCTVIHGVNAHTMSQHPELRLKRFDRIVFNFPHAGFHYSETRTEQIELHQNLLKGFFSSARQMLTDVGEVHVTHKTTYPYSAWRVKHLANDVGLRLLEEAAFSEWDYMGHGYVNKRGSGGNIDGTFPVGVCSTFKFCIRKDGDDEDEDYTLIYGINRMSIGDDEYGDYDYDYYEDYDYDI